MNTIYLKKSITPLKVFIIFALLTTISGCRALSEKLDPGESENLRAVKREKPNLSNEAEKINVDPDSDALTEEKTNPDSVVEKPNTALVNSNTSTNSNSSTNANLSANQPDKETSTAENVVTHNSFGKIKVGMTVPQASQALGTELVAPNGKGECYFVQPKQGFKGVDFMVIDGIIARIDIKSKDFVTDKGAKIGDAEATIKSLYKGVVVTPQKYDAKKNDLEVYSDDKKFLIIFETDGKVVTGFRVGRVEEVSLSERCG